MRAVRGQLRGDVPDVQASRGRIGRQVPWRHGGARASATRLSDWREDNDDWHWASQLGRPAGPGQAAQCQATGKLPFS